jgi:hypothetical protein
MLRHQWAAKVITSRNEPGPAVMDYLDSMAGILRRGGFSIDLIHHAFHALGSRGLGFSQELFYDDPSIEMTPETTAQMVSQLRDRYPNIALIVERVYHDDATVVGSGCDDQVEFEFALDLLLDGLEKRLLGES